MNRPTSLRIAIALLVSTAAAASLAAAPDPRKVVRTAYPSAESKLDPAAESDEASGSISHAIFDPLLTYDFLARPAKLKGNTASLPEIADDGATFTLRIRPGIFFAPDPAFGGRPRELTAHDYVYSIKRLLDPKLRSQWLFLVEGKIRGGDAAMKAAKESGRFDYDRPIEGLQALDRYTIRIRLANSDYSFPYVLAMPCHGRARPRSGRALRRGHRAPPRGHRPLPRRRVGAGLAPGARGQPRLPRGDTSTATPVPTRRAAPSTPASRASACRSWVASRSTSSTRRSRAGSPS